MYQTPIVLSVSQGMLPLVQPVQIHHFYQQPVVALTQHYVTTPLSVILLSADSDYLPYLDPIIDSFQYNQNQVLAVDSNNYSTKYDGQTYQQHPSHPLQVQVVMCISIIYSKHNSSAFNKHL